MQTSWNVRVGAGLLAIAGFAQCATYLWQSFGWAKWDLGRGLAVFLGYYTNWAMFLTGAACSVIALDKAGRRTAWFTTLALVATITMMLGYWTAVTWSQYRSNPLYHQTAHGPVPLALLLFWLTCIRHGSLRFRDAFVWPVVPLVYAIWMLLYGFFSGRYPYWQLDPNRMGWRHIGVDVLTIGIATLGCGLAIVWFDRKLAAVAMRSATRNGGLRFGDQGAEPVEP